MMRKILYSVLLVITSACAQEKTNTKIDQAFKDYWYAGKAEITSYDLEQGRYGEIKKGHAVNIFVTEPFSKKYNTKADQQNADNISVLKLNATLKFNTGIYPYSVMTSSFVPVKNPTSSLKISSSIQEWCGQDYMELANNNDAFEMSNFSYFQGASFKNKKIDKDIVLEDDVWSKIRLTPNNLPQGSFKALPALVYFRFSHKKAKAYEVKASLVKGDKENIYQLDYPELNRVLKITFENTFPYKILGWTEMYESGWGAKKKMLTTKATLKKTLNIAYWQKNSNDDLYLRKELGLE